MPSRKGRGDKQLRPNGVSFALPTPGAGRWVRVHATHPTAQARTLALSPLAQYCLVHKVEEKDLLLCYEHDKGLGGDHTVLYILVNTNRVSRLRKQASELSKDMSPYGLVVSEGDAEHPIMPPPRSLTALYKEE